jgi:Rad3-related DNA helicase
MIDRDFVAFGNIAITEFARKQDDRPDTRMLVLFPSYNLIDAFHAGMPHLHSRIIARQQGSNLHRDIARYAATPHGIFFGVDWEGVNFVDPESHRTLVDFLVLSKIPQPPSDHIRMDRLADIMVKSFHDEPEKAKRKAFGVSLREGSAHAYRKMVQGVGRGVRNHSDVIEGVLILDYRFPVPRHVAHTRRIIRCGGNAAPLFGNFDSLFDPYAVQQWAKMEKTGEIVPVYPIHQ